MAEGRARRAFQGFFPLWFYFFSPSCFMGGCFSFSLFSPPLSLVTFITYSSVALTFITFLSFVSITFFAFSFINFLVMFHHLHLHSFVIIITIFFVFILSLRSCHNFFSSSLSPPLLLFPPPFSIYDLLLTFASFHLHHLHPYYHLHLHHRHLLIPRALWP